MVDVVQRVTKWYYLLFAKYAWTALIYLGNTDWRSVDYEGVRVDWHFSFFRIPPNSDPEYPLEHLLLYLNSVLSDVGKTIQTTSSLSTNPTWSQINVILCLAHELVFQTSKYYQY